MPVEDVGSPDSLVRKTVLVKLPVQNPLKVLDDSGALIGSANLRFADGAVALDFELVHDHPAVFNLETDNGLARISLNGFFDDNGLEAFVLLGS